VIYNSFGLALSLNFVLIRIAESPAEFFSENKNIAGFDNVSFLQAMFI
jgi:DNA topoisomerase VI subunit B